MHGVWNLFRPSECLEYMCLVLYSCYSMCFVASYVSTIVLGGMQAGAWRCLYDALPVPGVSLYGSVLYSSASCFFCL